MAAKNTEQVKAEAQEVKAKIGEIQEGNRQANQKEAVYTLAEFVENAETVFHTRPECAFAALKHAGITECTKAEAVEIVKKFMGRKVG